MKAIKKQAIPYFKDLKLLDILNDQLMISIIDALGRYVYVNENFCEFHRLPYNKLIGETQTLLETHLHSDPFYKNLWETIMDGKTWKGILKGDSSIGDLFWLDTTIVPILKAGKIEQYVVIHVDITKSQLELQKSKEKEQQLKAFSDGIPNVVLSVNRFGNILNINQGLGALSKTEVIGSSIYAYINPDHHKKVQKTITSVFIKGLPSQYETVSFDSQGEEIHYVSQVGPVLDQEGRVSAVIISAQDISNIVKENKELFHKESKYRTLFQSINIGIIIVADDQGHITEWNLGAEKAFGYKAKEIIGNPLTKLVTINNQQFSVKDLVRLLKKTKKATQSETIEMIGLKKNGKKFPVQFALSRWKKNNRVYYCAMMLDVTKSKTLETKLSEKTRELEMFLYRSAHDLKAPLASAEGLLDLIKDEELNPTVASLTNMLKSTINKGSVIIDDLNQVAEFSKRKEDV